MTVFKLQGHLIMNGHYTSTSLSFNVSWKQQPSEDNTRGPSCGEIHELQQRGLFLDPAVEAAQYFNGNHSNNTEVGKMQYHDSGIF